MIDIVTINFDFSQGTLNLEVGDRIGVVYHFFDIDLLVAVGDILEVIYELEEIVLVRVHEIVDLLLEAIQYT